MFNTLYWSGEPAGAQQKRGRLFRLREHGKVSLRGWVRLDRWVRLISFRRTPALPVHSL